MRKGAVLGPILFVVAFVVAFLVSATAGAAPVPAGPLPAPTADTGSPFTAPTEHSGLPHAFRIKAARADDHRSPLIATGSASGRTGSTRH